MDTNIIDCWFEHEKEAQQRLQDIVLRTMNEEKLIVENLLHPPQEVLTREQRISDKVGRFGGSWKFIIFFAIILTVWIVYNVTAPRTDVFDPYLFILMNLGFPATPPFRRLSL